MKPYYEDEAVTIYHGDCREIAPSLSVEHVITDPPYADETHKGARGGAGDTKLIDFESWTGAALRELYGALNASRWLIATMDWRHVYELEKRPPASWAFVRFGVWVKPNGAPQFTGDRPATGWEAVAILHRERRSKDRMRWNNGGHHAVWTVPKVNGAHPTTKPDELVEAFVLQFTDPGESILDPFMGSGTTLVAAKRHGRKAIGIDREERYCEIAARRLSLRFASDVGLFGAPESA